LYYLLLFCSKKQGIEGGAMRVLRHVIQNKRPDKTISDIDDSVLGTNAIYQQWIYAAEPLEPTIDVPLKLKVKKEDRIDGMHIYLVSLILANKYLREPPASNKAWARLDMLPDAKSLTVIERYVLGVIGFELFIGSEQFKEMCSLCLKYQE
jgi:hypothetical protein